MADNRLAQAYSILGQATTAEYKRRRKEEEDREKRMMRQQMLGYFAAPLLKGAGEAVAEGVTDLIRSPFEKKYENFLESEEFQIAQSKQKSAFAAAQNTIKEDDTAVLDPEGRKNYYTQKKYERILADFEANYPEEEYKEGVNGLFWKQAEDWTEKNLPLIDSQVEAARKIKSPEDYRAAYGDMKPRSLGQILADGTRKLFGRKTVSEIRQERLDFLAAQSNVNREALLEAKRALGPDKPISKIVEAASTLNDYRIKPEDYIEISRKEKTMPVRGGDGKQYTRIGFEVTKKHPNKNQTITTFEDRLGQPIKLADTAELRQGTDVLGRKFTYEVKSTVTNEGVQINSIGTPNIEPASPTIQASKASAGERRLAFSAADQVSRALTIKDGRSVKDSDIYRIFFEGPEGLKVEDEQLASDLQDAVHGYAATLRTLEGTTGLGPDVAYPLSATMVFRNLDSMVVEPTGNLPRIGKFIIGKNKFSDYDDFNLENSNGLDYNIVQRAGAVYALDAFYALESTNKALSITKDEENLLKDLTLNQFRVLPEKNRQVLISSFSEFPQLNKKEYGDNNDYTFVELLQMVDKGMYNAGL